MRGSAISILSSQSEADSRTKGWLQALRAFGGSKCQLTAAVPIWFYRSVSAGKSGWAFWPVSPAQDRVHSSQLAEWTLRSYRS